MMSLKPFSYAVRKDPKASLSKFAAECGVKYETLKPYCREDESKRKNFVFVGQSKQKLVPDTNMGRFCERMVVEQLETSKDRLSS